MPTELTGRQIKDGTIDGADLYSANASWEPPPTTALAATVKAYVATGWVAGVLKRWSGVAWEPANLRVRTPSGWV